MLQVTYLQFEAPPKGLSFVALMDHCYNEVCFLLEAMVLCDVLFHNLMGRVFSLPVLANPQQELKQTRLTPSDHKNSVRKCLLSAWGKAFELVFGFLVLR